MKTLPILCLLTAFGFHALATAGDTIKVKPSDLNINQLQTGSFGYLQFIKKSKDAIPLRISLISFSVQSETSHNRKVIVVKQQWNADTTTHTCYTVFDATDFSTIEHDTYWKRLGYKMNFDFEKKTAEFINAGNNITDSAKSVIVHDFQESFKDYNLNWHSDMLIYSMLSYQEGRTFSINYYDPGLNKSEVVLYTVGSEGLVTGSDGNRIPCWVLNHYNDGKTPENGYERFWISKKSNEVLKMEDFGGPGQAYRYKIKLGVRADE